MSFFSPSQFGRFFIAGTLLVLGISGCPKPGPTPVYPTPDADAGPTVSCDVACMHVSNIQSAPSFGACMGICQPIQDQKFAPCINNAKTLTDVNNCDH